MHVLDDPETYARLDPDGRGGRIGGLPEQGREAWEQASSFSFPADFAQAERTVILGLGGSAIAGDILRALAVRGGRKAVFVHRGYDLPGGVDEGTLVVASSYSGETEEVLSSFGRALEPAARKRAITAGGG